MFVRSVLGRVDHIHSEAILQHPFESISFFQIAPTHHNRVAIMGDIVSVIVKEAEKQPKPKKIDYRTVRQEKRKHVYMHGAWTHDEAKVTRRVKRWEAKKGTLSHHYIEFALSRAMFEGRNWECINILGEGSFGIVGLWQQFDNTGKLLDVSVPVLSPGLTNGPCSRLLSKRFAI